MRRVGGNENIPIDIRVLAATNSHLETLIDQGTFRQDLYYRLSVIPIEIKPLRERTEDILPLVYHFLRHELGEGKELPTVDQEVVSIMESYPWPGNVRELENAIKHALAFNKDGIIAKDFLPPKILEGAKPDAPGLLGSSKKDDYRGKSLKVFLRSKEREYVSQVLANVGGDKQRAAKALKISLATLYRKIPDPVE